jgi:hypothetical protein
VNKCGELLVGLCAGGLRKQGYGGAVKRPGKG